MRYFVLQPLLDVEASNRRACSATIDRQEAVTEARNQLNIVKSSELVVAKEQFDQLYQRQQAVAGRVGAGVVREALDAAFAKVGAGTGWSWPTSCSHNPS